MSTAVRSHLGGRLVQDVVVTDDATHLVTADGARVVVGVLPSRVQGTAAARGLRHLSWVRLVVRGGAVVDAEVAGVTRQPVRRGVSAPAALHLARVGLPTVVEEVG